MAIKVIINLLLNKKNFCKNNLYPNLNGFLLLLNKHKLLVIVILLLGFIFFGYKIGIISLEKVPDPELKIKEKNSVFYREIPVDYNSPLQHKLDIIHYFIDIDLFPEEKIINATVDLTGIYIDTIVSKIDLNFYDNLEITSLQLNESETEFIHEGFRLSILSEKELIDTFKIKISYKGTPKKSGLYGFVFGKINNVSLVYNLSEPVLTSSWIPCNDMPNDKALLDIIIKNNSGTVSASNGKLISKNDDGKRSSYHWKTFYPISTYLIAIYSSNYSYYNEYYITENNDSINIEYYVLPEFLDKAKIDFNEHIQMMDFFSKTFGEYPFIKEKYGVAQFLWQMGAMEHQTITGIGTSLVTGKKTYTDVLVHELAHHWWGNAVGPESWEDIWLNEGFAKYSEVLYEEHKNGIDALRKSMILIKDKFNDETLYAPKFDLFSSTIYDKGAWVLHMLRNKIGDKLFFSLLKEYYEKYKYKNASTQQFQKLAEEVSGKDLTTFFNQWVYEGKGIPEIVYNYSIKENENGYFLLLEFQQLQKEFEIYELELPIEITHIKNKDNFRIVVNLSERFQQIEIPLKIKPITIKVDPDETLLIDKNLNKEL